MKAAKQNRIIVAFVVIHGDGTTTDAYVYDHFTYNGEVYSGEDLGNIHFGFVGSTMYSPWFLHLGAGVVQILVGTKWKYWKTLFDEARDSDMIDYGIELYENR